MAFLAAVAPTQAAAYDVHTQVANEYGYVNSDVYDVGEALVFVFLEGGAERGKFCSPAKLTRNGGTLRITLTVEPGVPDFAQCPPDRTVSAGPLAAGRYSVETVLVDTSGGQVQASVMELEVKERGAVCGLTPDDNLLQLHFSGKDPAAFVQRFNSDAAFRASLGDISIHDPVASVGHVIIPADHPPLADLLRVWTALNDSPYIDLASRYGVSYGCPFTCIGDQIGAAVEYYNATFDRYFFTHDDAEIASLDKAATSGGWTRTGESWRVIKQYGRNEPRENVIQKVYRFWNDNLQGKPSHFFTVSQKECGQLRDGVKKNWTFEGMTFWARVPKEGACTTATDSPLYRLYNNSVGGAPSHRFTTKTSVIDQMTAKGWTSEGVAMCVAGQ